MQFEHHAKIVINVESSNLSEITTAFLLSLAPIFSALVSSVMLHYRDIYAKNGFINELLCLESSALWSWKSKKGYNTIVIKSLFGKISLPNPVVKIRYSDGSIDNKVLGRSLLGVSAGAQIPDFMKAMIGTLGSLMSFRNVHKSMRVFGIFKISLGSIRHSLQWKSQRLVIDLPTSELNAEVIFEADGTGVNTLHSGKRGAEAKILMQRKANGGLYFWGVKVGKYSDKKDWKALFEPLQEIFRKSSRCILLADGDESISELYLSLRQKGYCFFQRCLWHIPRQIKYMLWKDKADKKRKLSILSLTYNAFLLRKNLPIEEFADYIALKLARIENLILECNHWGFKTTATFLQNLKDNAFVLARSTKDNTTTALTERVMRTIKQRTRYAVWSDKGAENVIKIRLNHFYNHKELGLYFKT